MVAVAIFLFWKKSRLIFCKIPEVFFVVRQKSNFIDFGCGRRLKAFKEIEKIAIARSSSPWKTCHTIQHIFVPLY
jgi:hypothetical protein